MDFPLFPFLGIFWIVTFILSMVVAVLFWLWMFVDCLQRKFKDPHDKTVWIIVLIFTLILGAVLYFFLVKIKD